MMASRFAKEALEIISMRDSCYGLLSLAWMIDTNLMNGRDIMHEMGDLRDFVSTRLKHNGIVDIDPEHPRKEEKRKL